MQPFVRLIPILTVLSLPLTAFAEPIPIPAVVEAEVPHRFLDLTPGNLGDGVCGNSDLDVQLTQDATGNCNVAWTDSGEWVEYDIRADRSGTYPLVLRAATGRSGRTLNVLINGQIVASNVAVPSLGWQSFVDLTLQVELSQGDHVVRVLFNNGSVNLNYLDFRAPPAAAPGIRLPARIEAEHFTAYHDTTAANLGDAACNTGAVDAQTTADMNGGCNIAWTVSGEWTEYRVNSPMNAEYRLTLRAATGSNSRTLRVEIDGINVTGNRLVPNLGWQSFGDLNTNVTLSAGDHRVRVVYVNGSTNLNYLDFVRIAPAYIDSDADGIEDLLDNCSGSPPGGEVDPQGCTWEQRDDDQDGVDNAVDACPGTSTNDPADGGGCGYTQRDDDQDGVLNPADVCPDSQGPALPNGCSIGGDEDGDRLPNEVDLCPLSMGLAELRGCKPMFNDFDADGVEDALDQCPHSSPSAGVDPDGCSMSDRADDDFDGSDNSRDLCPNESGWSAADFGCLPHQLDDQDADGIINALDLCPGDFGRKRHNGCIDSWTSGRDADQDGVENQHDHCPFTLTTSGWAYTGPNGCAEDASLEDADQDGVANPSDLCPLSRAGHMVNTEGCTGVQAQQRLDEDNDGVNNAFDVCPLSFIDPSDPHLTLFGCHYSEFDGDRDGLPDQLDFCPWEPGHRMFAGCRDAPSTWDDADMDSTPDQYDLCPFSEMQQTPNPSRDGCQGDDRADFDNDGVINGLDLCPASPAGSLTDTQGCNDLDRLDFDQDGVMNGIDLCPRIAGLPSRNGCANNLFDADMDGVENLFDFCPYSLPYDPVDARGCGLSIHATDQDGDGVTDDHDQCRSTPTSQAADYHTGCSWQEQLAREDDSDNDGVGDRLDRCPSTPPGIPVDARGCDLPWEQRDDRDGDRVLDIDDRCPNTPRATAITHDGCEIFNGVRVTQNLHRPFPREFPYLEIFVEEVPVQWSPLHPHPQPLEFELHEVVLQNNMHVWTSGNRLDVDVPPHLQVRPIRIPVRLRVATSGEFSNWFEVVIGDRGNAAVSASLIVNDPQVLEMTGINLSAAFHLLTTSGSHPQPETELFRQLWDSQRSTSSLGLPFFCTGETNGFPIVCDQPGTEVATWDDYSVTREMDNYRLTAVVNRFDLHNNWQDCGEHRLVFALQSGIPQRKFLNLEARLPNPMPGDIQGCRPVIEFWRDLATVSGNEQAQRLNQFFYGGPFGTVPAITPAHFRADTGQIRSTQFWGGEWLFKEHKLEEYCGASGTEPCRYWVRTGSVKENPFGGLFNPQMAMSDNLFSNIAQDFQQWFPQNLAGLLTNNPAEMRNRVAERFNHGQSHASGPNQFENDYLAQFNGEHWSAFGMQLDMAIQGRQNADGSPLTVENILARATAMTCAGCHAPDSFLSDFRNQIGVLELPDGNRINQWPLSHDFVHINEAGELSPAMREVFLPARGAMFEGILREMDLMQ